MNSGLLTLLIIGIIGFIIIVSLTIAYHIKQKYDKKEMEWIKTFLNDREE